MRKLKKEVWPYMIQLDMSKLESTNVEIAIWLSQNLGKSKVLWNIVYNYNSTDFYFKVGKDATMFSLRWL